MARVRPALVVWLLALLVVVASGWVLLPYPRVPTGWEEIAWSVGFGMGFTTVGALLVDRRPREPVSRITLWIGLLVVASLGLRAIAVLVDSMPGEIPPAAVIAAVTSQGLQTLAFLAAGTFLIVRFPRGREPGRLSDAADVLVALMVVAILVQALTPGPVDIYWLSPADNPIGIPALGTAADTLGTVVLGGYAGGLAIALAILVRRYRRADAVVRAQIRWVAAAASVTLLLVPLILLADWLWTAWFLSTALLPVAIGIAILRYRLFDIDRIVSRTLAYALVTALLAAVLVATNLALQAVVATAAGGNTLFVAGSTLLVASLFQPIRRRIQAPIDRRFNRAQLDAERVIATFGRETRDEVDLELLRGAVVRTVDGAVRPARLGLWLRGSAT